MKKYRNILYIISTQCICTLAVVILNWLYSIYFQLNIAKFLDLFSNCIYTLGYFLVLMFIVYCVTIYNGFLKRLCLTQGYLFLYVIINLIGQVVLGRLKFLGFYPIALTEWMMFTAFFFLFLGFHRLFLHNKT